MQPLKVIIININQQHEKCLKDVKGKKTLISLCKKHAGSLVRPERESQRDKSS